MSSINSLLAQNISSLYETSGLYKTSSSSDTSATSKASSYFGEDTLTLSSDGLSLLQSLLSAKETDNNTDSESEENDKDDIISQLKELASSDKLSDDTKSALSDIISEIEDKLTSIANASESATSDASASENRPMMPPPPPKDGELPPMPPEAFNSTTSSSSDSSSTTGTAYSQEDTLINSDNTSETEEGDYPLNLEALVSSGLISQAQSDLIKNAYDYLNT